MPERGSLRVTPQLVLGLGILAVGLLFTAEQLGFSGVEEFIDYWPVVLILVGATRLGGGRGSDKVFAFFWIALGAWLLAWNFDYIDANPLEFFWPAVLILVGTSLLRGALRGRARTADEDSTVSIVAVMGGVERRNSSPAFAGGDITAFMGGGKLDLTQARLAEGDVEVQIFAMWGGYELRLPPDWEVSIDIVPLLGGVEDKRTHQESGDGTGRLVLKGVVIMGGIELKT